MTIAYTLYITPPTGAWVEGQKNFFHRIHTTFVRTFVFDLYCLACIVWTTACAHAIPQLRAHHYKSTKHPSSQAVAVFPSISGSASILLSRAAAPRCCPGVLPRVTGVYTNCIETVTGAWVSRQNNFWRHGLQNFVEWSPPA